jgi:hypothetical protein
VGELTPRLDSSLACLRRRDPADRLVIEEVLQHPFCAEAVAHAFELERRAALKDDALDAALAELEDDD